MCFKDNLNRICHERGTYLSTVVKDLGISTSAVTRWNNGSLPKEEQMVALAKYLNCSVMDFFSDDESLSSVHEVKEHKIEHSFGNIPTLSSDEGDILDIFRSLDRKGQHQFMAEAYKFDKR